ncbi:MAG: uroporphyrinogen-III synthase [Gammaproteobacteria bacterium]
MPEVELQGLSVLVTRPAAQAQHLSEAILRLGGKAVALPLLEIQPRAPSAIPNLREMDILIFVSANAVEHGLNVLGPLPAALLIGAIGRATAQCLAAFGIRADLLPTRADSEGFLALPEIQELTGKKVLIVRGQGGRETLATQMRARGAAVRYLEVYRRVCPHWRAEDLETALRADVITVTSGEALENLARLARLPGGDALWTKPMLVFHQRIAGRARELGFTLKPVVSAKPGDEALLTALQDWVNQQKGTERA